MKKTKTTKKKAKPAKKTKPAKKKKPAKKTKAAKKTSPTKKPPAPPKGTSVIDLAALHGVTDRTVRAWIKKGCPCRRVKGKTGGRARVFLDIIKVAAWLDDNDIRTKYIAAADSSPPDPPASPPPNSDPDLPKSGIVGAVARLRAMERISYAAFVQAVQKGQSSASIRGKEKIYIEAHQALRRTEKEVPAILEHRGEMIPLETVLQEQSKIDLAIKNELLTFPRKVAGLLAPISDPGEIEEILQGEIDDCLRHIASGAVLQDEPA